MKFKMFHVPKPRKYGYQPIYYNSEQDENIIEKKKNHKQDVEKDRDNKYWKTEMDRINRKRTINITMYIFIILLLLCIVFLM